MFRMERLCGGRSLTVHLRSKKAGIEFRVSAWNGLEVMIVKCKVTAAYNVANATALGAKQVMVYDS